MHQLQSLVRDQQVYRTAKIGTKPLDTVEIHMEELENRAKSLNIYDLRPFYESLLFRNNSFEADDRRKVIIKSF